MNRLACLLLTSSIGFLACATDNNTTPEGGGGDAPIGGEGGSQTVGGASTGGGGGGTGCAQDCSTIEVPSCYQAVCNEESGICEIGPAGDGTACDDGLFCTTGEVCSDGECEGGSPTDCTDGDDDPCLVAACDEARDSCSTATAANGTSCVSTDICTSNAICQNGVCQGAPLDCSLTPLTSPECEAAACDSTTGLCVVMPVNDGAPCIYGDVCQSDKSCSAGVCSGTPISGCTSCTETEPNNDYASANSGVGCEAWAGGLVSFGDQDCFEIDVTVPGSRITASIVDVGGGACPAPFSFEIILFDAVGNFLASDFGSTPSGCPTFLPDNVGATNLAAGTYSVCVGDPFGSGGLPPYLLLLSALAPGCGNAIVEGTEECDGTSFGGNSCVSEGFAGGTLGCDASCALDTSGCVMPGCGNALLELGEDCDGSPASCTASCTFACGGGQVPFSVNGVSPVAIPDFGLSSSTASVPTTGTIASLGVQINLTHTFDGDLEISISSPSGTNVALSQNNGGGDDDFTNTVFSSAGASNIASGIAPFQGVFTPNGTLSSFNGQSPAGTWTLNVDDQAGGDSGTINGWRVFGCVNP